MNPIELYLSFQSNFFNARRGNINKAEKKKEKEANALKYRTLLNKNAEIINAVLLGESNLSELPCDFFCELNEVIEFERKHTTTIKKISVLSGLELTERTLCEFAKVKLNEIQSEFLKPHNLAHLARLIFPVKYAENIKIWELDENIQNTFCENFGREFIQYVSTLDIKDKYCDELQDFMKVVSIPDSYMPLVFWTIAPYVHHNLKIRGLNPNESMGKIFQWARDSYRKNNQRKSENNLIHTYGFKEFDYDEQIPLGYDERMPTHLRSNLMSKIISKEL